MKSQRVLVFCPHPDDEAIGCGGTLRWHVEQADRVCAVFLTSGERGVPGQEARETGRARESEAKAAAALLGYRDLEFWREPDGSLRLTAALVRRAEQKLRTWKPTIIYAPHSREMHPDHRAAARLVRRALSTTRLAAEVRWYEVWTPLPTIGHVQDITAQIERKLAAIRAHRSQCGIMRFDEAALGLARFRGEMHSWPGGPYAEVFAR